MLAVTLQPPALHPDLPAPGAGPPPDQTFWAVRGGVAVARAAVWHQGPPWNGQRTGAVGHYAALDDEAAALVLAAALDDLRRAGAQLALGPLDGNTWFKYRLVTQAGTRPPFALEPWNTDAEVRRWQAAGFGPLLTYHSRRTTPDTSPTEPRAAELAERFGDVTLRVPDPSTPEALRADLDALHQLSLAAFAGNPLYTPLPLAAFEALYRPLLGPPDQPTRHHLPLDWVWLAERSPSGRSQPTERGELVGFVFAYPDPGSLRGGRPSTLVLKTLAIRPGRHNAGLGRHLSHLLHTRAFAAGFGEVIHALMWDGNESAALSQRRGDVLRRYALLACALSARA